MKKSEMKARMEAFRNTNYVRPPMVHKIVECKDKQYSKQGCQACWYCDACGQVGCDNLLSYQPGDSIEKIPCMLEEG